MIRDRRAPPLVLRTIATFLPRIIDFVNPTLWWKRTLFHYLYAILRKVLSPSLMAKHLLYLGEYLNRRDHFKLAALLLGSAKDEFLLVDDLQSVAQCVWQEGVALRTQQPAEAARLMKTALQQMEEIGTPIRLALAKRDLAITYNLLGNLEEAARMLMEARILLEQQELVLEEARCDLVQGALFQQLTRYHDALQILTHAHQIFEVHGAPIDQAKASYLQALVHIQLQEFETAETSLQEAEQVFTHARLPLRVAYCRLTRGRIKYWQGNLAEAKELIESARKWFARAKMAQNSADCLLSLGNVAFMCGKYERAQTYYNEAQKIYTEIGSNAFSARCIENIARVHKQMGRFDLALQNLYRASQALEDLEVLIWAADCHHEIATIYNVLHEPSMAHSHLEYAKQYYRREGVALSEAQCEALTALILKRENREADVLIALQKAQKIALSSGSTLYTAWLKCLTGDYLVQEGHFVEAIEEYRTAIDRIARVQDPVNTAFCLVGMGIAYLRLGQLDQAENFLLSAQDSSPFSLSEVKWRVCAGLGELASVQSQTEQALRWYKEARTALHDTRLTITEPWLASGFAFSASPVYQQYVHLALQLGHPHQAIEAIEDDKSQTLKRLVQEVPSYSVEDRISELVERERGLRNDIVRIRQSLLVSVEDIPTADERSDFPADVLLEELRRLRVEHKKILQQLHTRDLGKIEAREIFKWERFLTETTELLFPRTIYLTYYWLEDQLVIISVDRERGTVRSCIRRPNRVDEIALKMYTSPAPERRLLAFGAAAPGQFDDSVERKHRQRLFDLLIPGDIRGRLTPELNLILVPHGNLHNLPFGTLESAGRTLTEQATLSQVPSLAVLEGLLRRKRRKEGKGRTRDRALLVGIETFKQSKPALRATVNEVQRLREIYNDSAYSLCLCNGRATTSQIHTMNGKGELEKYTIIHFATHAYLDATFGTISALSLWDADLAITDIVRLRLGSPTVVLSACQSGLGKIYSGDEASSLAYAFLAAGANSVVASLWHIEDVNTGDLMVAFHRKLQAGGSPARALAEAQREVIQKNVSPYVWGAFRVVGIP